jgi:DNA-directed RNA polymerase II subunit RPB2
MENETIWNIIECQFRDDPQSLVRHHIDSYNDFYKTSIFQIFKEKNPISLYSREDPTRPGEFLTQCNLYMGGKEGNKIYFGKPVINDTSNGGESNSHFMFPNEARLRNMTYAMTIHYDIDVEVIETLAPGEAPRIIGGNESDKIEGEEGKKTKESLVDAVRRSLETVGGEKDAETKGGAPARRGIPKPTTRRAKESDKTIPLEMTINAATQLREITEQSLRGSRQISTHTVEKVYLGKFPIMLQSNFCILQGLSREVRFSMGECRNDIGGYFIIDGKEKTVVCQEKFADNMLYVRKIDDDKFLYSAEIRSVSENVSKPVRTLSIKIVAPSTRYTNKQIVVNIPNVRAPVPLFIVFRALGILSDKEIISFCLLDLDKYESLVDLFIPSVHDAANIMTQQNALQYIALLTKGKGISHALEILSDYLLPHIGEINYIPKAYALGHMVFKLLSVYAGMDTPTDRDNFKYKRVELVGSLLYDLFREYWNLQLKQVHVEFEKRLYYNKPIYENKMMDLIKENQGEVFRERLLETGFRKAFKGNWGAQTHTKRIGVVQDLNRLSFNSALNHLRKTNLPLDSSVKLVGPRVLHNSHWGYLDPIDTPDGGNIGLHKHLAISTSISRGMSREPIIAWLRENWAMKLVEEHRPIVLASKTKVFVNGCLIGAVDHPIQCVQKYRLYRRNGLLPVFSSATFDIRTNIIYVYCDAGRLCRPIFYRDDASSKKASFAMSKTVQKALVDRHFSWTQLISGFNKKRASVDFDPTQMKLYTLYELYEGVESETNPAKLQRFLDEKAVIDCIDCSESENTRIALTLEEFEQKDSMATHMEIHHSLIFGMMCNLIVYPENNPAVRNSFSCGQSKQAVSMYHTNYNVRMDKTMLILNSGQTPLVKTKYMEFLNHEENPYGENAIVAIMCYTGYNMEDSILINEGAIQRGLFRTSYFTCYESHEESTKNANTLTDKRFMNIETNPLVRGIKPGYDYSKLDENGIIREGTPVDDHSVLIGMASVASKSSGNAVEESASYVDESKTPKKGQVGVVDKAFITDGEDGTRIAKVRIVEQRIPTFGDKMASRAGQKGTIGLVIPERDMPFTAEGIRPDLIINPHALPTRMTIGQLVECLTGKASAHYGAFGNCTAYDNQGSKVGVFGEFLTKMGYHSSGNELLYNGMTGEQIETEIFIGPTYYMRLKHMPKDKINYRGTGPRTALTKQPVGGRANDGGLRIGEMERDTVISHGMNEFLRESMMERGDKSYVAICNKTGMLSIYNPAKGLFMSPMADGPIQYTGSFENDNLRVEHVTKFGRDFSVVCIPYSLKLLIQELQTINISLRIITEDNIDQIEHMTYSHNIAELLHDSTYNPRMLVSHIRQKLRKHNENDEKDSILESPELKKSPDWAEGSPAYFPSKNPDIDSAVDLTELDFLYKGGKDSDRASKTSLDEEDLDEKSAVQDPIVILDEVEEDSLYKIGDQVYLRGNEFPNVIWSVHHLGDKFITIKPTDPRMVPSDKQVMVVGKYDILPVGDVLPFTPAVYPSSPMISNGMVSEMPPLMQGVPPPVYVNVSPKFFNHGNDQSTNTAPPETIATNTDVHVNSNIPIALPINNQSVLLPNESNTTISMPVSSESEKINFSDPLLSKNLLIVKK